MTNMADVQNKVQDLVKSGRNMFEWRRLSPVQKLFGLSIVASIATVMMDRWGLLIVLIISMVGFAYLTERALSGGWLASPDPLADLLRWFEYVRETLSVASHRLFNTDRVTDSQDLRKRSESIASSHIPDLDVEVESVGSGSTSQKKIRLELNSIILLIIRDFVQFWYNTFSYNSQFLKDARQFLFRGFYNVAERLSRLGPHKTSAKFIHAYRKHLSSFQTAQSVFDQCQQSHQTRNSVPYTRTKLKRLESVDEAFQSKFQFHPALRSKEAEKQYLRSLTKVILLCSCNRDVVSAQSAQIFFLEILSVNVMLPVVDMLSTPDRLYEILIKLTYTDSAILSEDTLRELIDLEVKRMQLERGVGQVTLATPTSPSYLQVNVCTEITESSQSSGKSATPSLEEAASDAVAPSLESEAVCQVVKRKSKDCDGSAATVPLQTSDQSVVTSSRNGGPGFSRNAVTGNGDKSPLADMSLENMQVAEDNEGNKAVEEKVPPESVQDSAREEESGAASSEDGLSSSSQEKEAELASDRDSVPVTVSEAESAAAQRNHLYGEIVSTNVPLVKPKLQALKDLFKSKKSKQEDSSLGKDQGTGEAQKSQDSDSKSASDGILPTQKLKSLRLSPLLNRSSKHGASETSIALSSSSQSSRNGASGKKASEADKQTPSPQPTPSPSQQSKGGPLSFLRFRKPTLEFRKSSVSGSEDKGGDSASTKSSSTSTDDADISPRTSSSTSLVPTVQVTEENGDDNLPSDPTPTPTPALTPALTPPQQDLAKPVSVSSYVEMTLSPSEISCKSSLFLSPGDEIEEGEEAETLRGDVEETGTAVVPLDSSMIFQDISIPSTMTCKEYRSNSQFTVYQIEYEALHFSETGIPVLKTGTAKRRYREFVNLMSCLTDNAAYKQLLKDVKGPKRWMTLPFKNMDKESVASRQKALEQFLQSLIKVEAICNGPEMREFLAYEGDSHIAFVKKSTEINVPRFDKMLARTVSGVFDKLKSLPNLPQEMISGIRGRDSVSERKDTTSETDTDSISVVTDFSHDMSFDNMLRDISESYIREIQTQGHPELSPSSPTTQLLMDVDCLSQQILLHLPRAQGDGAENPDTATEAGTMEGKGLQGQGQLLLCDAVLDLIVQLLTGRQHWLCHQRVLSVFRNVLGRTVDRWLRETVCSLTTEERCLYYVRLLRETVWPGGKFFTSQAQEKTKEERLATRNVAKRLLLDFFPGAVRGVVGEDSMDSAVDMVLESLQYNQLNKHFLYTSIDMLLESLFPEIADPQFQNRLLS